MSKIEFVDTPSATLVDSMASDDDVAMAAWVSFGNDDAERLQDKDRMKGLINFLMREKHLSPFEHSTFKFRIDCPLFVAREFHRHRTMSYNEVSGRYTVMKPRFYVPGKYRPVLQQGKTGAYTFVKDDGKLVYAQSVIMAATESSWAEYNYLLNEGVAKEVARMVLPVNLMTQFYATVNARNLMHFLGLRTSPQALYEIRLVANYMALSLEEKMPLTYAAWEANNG